MAYIVNNTVNAVVATIADGTIDTTSTSLTLLGKGFNNYGEIVAEDWVHIIEHFASPTAPVNALRGQLWFDTTAGKLKVNTSSTFGSPVWIGLTQTIVNGIAPTPATHGYGIGALWYDTTNSLLNISIDGVAWSTVKATKSSTGGEPPILGSDTGDLFYDEDTKELKVLNPNLHGLGSAGWDIVGPARYKGGTAPTGAKDGDEWWDSDKKQLKIYDSLTGTYRLIGPSTPSGLSVNPIGAGLETGQYPVEIDNKALLMIVVDDNVVGIWSKEDFTPAIPIRSLVSSGTGTITNGVPSNIIGPGRQWHFHNASDTGATLKIERGLNLSTIVGVDTEPTVFNGLATKAQYS